MLDARGPQTTRANGGAPRVQRDDLYEWPTLDLQAHERLRAGGDARGALACAAEAFEYAVQAGGFPLASDIVKLARMRSAARAGRRTRVHRQAAAALAVVLARAATRYWPFLQFSALMSRTWLRIPHDRATLARGAPAP
jgi:hypothetical protein